MTTTRLLLMLLLILGAVINISCQQRDDMYWNAQADENNWPSPAGRFSNMNNNQNQNPWNNNDFWGR